MHSAKLMNISHLEAVLAILGMLQNALGLHLSFHLPSGRKKWHVLVVLARQFMIEEEAFSVSLCSRIRSGMSKCASSKTPQSHPFGSISFANSVPDTDPQLSVTAMFKDGQDGKPWRDLATL